MRKCVLFVLLIGCCLSPKAKIRLPALVGNHMVLQRDKPIRVWGYAKAGEIVNINFAGVLYHTTTDTSGIWRVKLKALKAGGPYQMTLSGENNITLNDILIGDVWVCSGQSNMEFPLSIANNADEEVKNANYDHIRLYNVDKGITLTPRMNSNGSWVACNSQSVKNFPAVAYFFARDLQQQINIPIGLINASWGGTVVESWISKEGLQGEVTFGEKANQVAQFDTVAYNKEHRKLHQQWVDNFNRQDGGSSDGKYLWARNKVDTDDWKTIKLPTIWEFTGYTDLWEMDGTVWFRKKINLTQADIQDNATLNLGVIQNADETFVNGMKVGQTPDIWGKNRAYQIPHELLNLGENIITVRVENYGGDGGFVDRSELFYLKTKTNSYSLAGEWLYKIGYTLTKFDRPEKEMSPNTLPTLMYNNMINPLINLSIKGVLWYQGESNWFRAYQYRQLFPLMIADWRNEFNQGNFPFLYVQLAGYHRKLKQPEPSTYWAELREAQDVSLKVKNTGMVTAYDVGDSSNVHPKNKQEVGRRLALLAEKKIYGISVLADAPHYNSFQVKDNYIVIKVSNQGDRLTAIPKVSGFQIAGADKKFYWADADILNGTNIKVFSTLVQHPVAVRYAWEDDPADANVYNEAHLPLFPFRTDTWKGLTDGNK